jgi:hypothetical protein
MTGLIEGFFASAWFSWGQDDPPDGLIRFLEISSVVAILVAIAGGILAIRSPAASTTMADPIVRKRYFILVGIEFGALAIGAVIFGLLGWGDYIPVMVCAGVGLHFIPLAQVLRSRMLVPLGVLLIIVSGVALVVGLSTDIAMSAVTGVGAGSCLLLFACLSLVDIPRTA